MATRRRSGAPLFLSGSSAVSRLATGFSISGASINREALQLRTARLRYFFYGTLMDRAVLAAVLGRAPAAPPRAAILHGYRRMFRHGASYPVLAPAAGEAVSGVVVEGLGEGDARRLEAFEGRDYALREMPVRLCRGRHVPAMVFMPIDPAAASAVPWSPGDWHRRYRRQYLQRIGRSGKPG